MTHGPTLPDQVQGGWRNHAAKGTKLLVRKRRRGRCVEIKEYVLGLLAIITGLAISDMVVSVHALLQRFGRTRWDWLLMTAAALVFVVIVQSGWIA